MMHHFLPDAPVISFLFHFFNFFKYTLKLIEIIIDKFDIEVLPFIFLLYARKANLSRTYERFYISFWGLLRVEEIRNAATIL